MEDADYDIFLTLKFTSHYSSKLANDYGYRHQIYKRYWKKVNEILYGKRNTTHSLKTEQVQHFGEYNNNAHLHARVKCPSFMNVEDLCKLLNTIWKAQHYTEASSPQYNHITPIICNERVHDYMTRQQHEIDYNLSTQEATFEITNSTKARHTKAHIRIHKAHTRIHRFITQPHINRIHQQSKEWYPLHVQRAKLNFS